MPFIKNFSTLATSPERKAVFSILEAGLEAIQPANVLGDELRIKNHELWIKGEKYDLDNFQRIFLVGLGKGSAEISRIVGEKLGDHLTAGWVIDAQVPKRPAGKIEYTVGTHPLPSETNVSFTRGLITQLTKLTPSDLVLVVVCGGGSALFTDPTVPVEELIKINQGLLRSGKTIAEMNRERKKWDRVKGGGLAERLRPAKVVGLIFSDVPGNDLATIASGPTVDGSAENFLMVSNLTALEGMKKKAEELGFGARVYSDRLQGEAREVGQELINKAVAQLPNKGILLAAGETTVTARGNGKGGRNQELVLAAVDSLSKTSLTRDMVIAAVDSDGWDNTEVAGAIGDNMTVRKAESLGLSVEGFLEKNDAYNFFQKVGDYIETGRLPMNVADLIVLLRSI